MYTSLQKPGHYLTTLIQKSDALTLDKDPTWHILVLYQSRWLRSPKSQVSDPNFFLSAQGNQNPQAELHATLAAFFSTQNIPPTKVSSQCRYPARYHWLNQKLQFDMTLLKVQPCKNLDHFYHFLDTGSLTLVFPSTHPNSPSSMFGHTLLRFNRKGRRADARMLDMSMTYNAIIPTDISAFKYIYFGLTNGYMGKFSLLPYYLKLREYSDIESRGLWEYNLSIPADKLKLIVMHAFELSITFFNYKFFTENCSYHLLSLIDAAFPNESLTSAFNHWTLPVATIKYLDHRGLIDSVTFDPSLTQKILVKTKQLPPKDYQLVVNTYKNGFNQNKQQLVDLPEQNQARVLDVLSDLYRYRKLGEANTNLTKLSLGEKELLKMRSKNQIKLSPLMVPIPHARRPDKGHPITRYTTSLVAIDDQPYVDLEWRPAYHDLLDPSVGFAANSGLEILKTRVKFDTKNERLQLDKITLFNIQSLEPRHALFNHISWRLNLKWQQLLQSDERWRAYTSFDLGAGLTDTLGESNKNLIYTFANFGVRYGKVFNKNFSIMPGGTVGVLLEPIHRWRLKMQLTYKKGLLGDTNDYRLYEIEQNLSVLKRMSIGVYWQRERLLENHQNSMGLKIHYYGGY